MDLYVTDEGEGTPVVLLHGLTASHRYVVMGSKALERSGHRVIAYDARGHGKSDPAPEPQAYRYEDLRDDLVRVMDERGIDRAVLAGASMGAHTLLRLALEQPERAAGLVIITPAYDPDELGDDDSLARWDELADGLRKGGIEGFVEAYGDPGVPEEWRETVFKVIRQRLAAHEHLEAVADALQAVPRSRPFERIDDLAAIDAPTVVVADRDEADPGHPLAIGEAYAEAIPGAELRVEEEGKSPLAWQGSQLSNIIADVARRAG
ncbi:MAG TPA: alpha/beta hydrolase [Solirubrobacteraceae bacterium]|nr:alpha/beta hydrolase [Solirubrobacteraceae bacterium]